VDFLNDGQPGVPLKPSRTKVPLMAIGLVTGSAAADYVVFAFMLCFYSGSRAEVETT
jgi:hypothetical protein